MKTVHSVCITIRCANVWCQTMHQDRKCVSFLRDRESWNFLQDKWSGEFLQLTRPHQVSPDRIFIFFWFTTKALIFFLFYFITENFVTRQYVRHPDFFHRPDSNFTGKIRWSGDFRNLWQIAFTQQYYAKQTNAD